MSHEPRCSQEGRLEQQDGAQVRGLLYSNPGWMSAEDEADADRIAVLLRESHDFAFPARQEDGTWFVIFYDDWRKHVRRMEEEARADAPSVDDICECGHARREHVMGTAYCTKGCYTTQAQADYCRDEFGERPVCTGFRKRKAAVSTI